MNQGFDICNLTGIAFNYLISIHLSEIKSTFT
jgi:hypothetical protein